MRAKDIGGTRGGGGGGGGQEGKRGTFETALNLVSSVHITVTLGLPGADQNSRGFDLIYATHWIFKVETCPPGNCRE